MDSPLEQMSAWTHTRTGLPSSVLSQSKIPKPGLTATTQVQVRISHCALNPGASIVMQFLPFLFRATPAIPEMDFAGVIESCHTLLSIDDAPYVGLKPGIEVFGSIPLSQHVKTTSGALAQYVVVDYSHVVRKPQGAQLEEVAGLGIAGATALEVVKHARLKKGDSVLVNGASGGIGHLIVQMCRAEVGETGYVVAVCSGNNVAWVQDLGCDEVIDYESHAPVHTYLAQKFGGSRFNAVLDAAGIQDIYHHCPAFLTEGKPYVTIGPRARSYTVLGMLTTIVQMVSNALWPRVLGGVSREYVQVTGISSERSLRELARMVEEKKIKVHVGMVVESENMKQAYEQLLSGHTQGKIVVEISHGDGDL